MPRASVVIPNFNNGRASSRGGRHDFLGALLGSLLATLSDDPTDLEIVVADDGSTDDSLATAREWSRRRWPDGSPRAGRPFLRLIELPHGGVLSRVLNVLLAETSGEVVCRLDGDVVVDTPRWVARLVGILDAAPDVAVVTGLQRLPDGRVHAFGDAILSPLGYHHLGQGARAEDLPEILEVEHAMGCMHASRRAAVDAVGGYDEEILRGQTEDLAMRLNRAGWRALATRAVEFRHFHAERHWRANLADTGEGLARSLARFEAKWGFDRLAPDLEEVWRRHRGTPLVARAMLDGPTRWTPESTGDLAPGDEWTRFASDGEVQAAIGAELALLRRCEGPIAVLGARSGLSSFLRARDGVRVAAVEEHAASVEAGRAFVQRARGAASQFSTDFVEDLGRTGLESGSFCSVILLDSIERYWNPVRILREGKRLLSNEGILVVRSRTRGAGIESRGKALHPFAAHELLQLVRHTGGLEPLAPPSSCGMGRIAMAVRCSHSSAHLLHFGA